MLLVLSELDPLTRARKSKNNTLDSGAGTGAAVTTSNSATAAADPSGASQAASFGEASDAAAETATSSTNSEASENINGLADPFEVVKSPHIAALFLAKPTSASPMSASSTNGMASSFTALSTGGEDKGEDAAGGLRDSDNNETNNSMAPEEVRALEESCLVPFLEGLLANESLLDMERHASLYVTACQVLRCFLKGGPTAQALLLPLPNQKPGRALLQLLLKHRKGLGVFLKSNGYMSASSQSSAATTIAATATTGAKPGTSASSSATSAPSSSTSTSASLASQNEPSYSNGISGSSQLPSNSTGKGRGNGGKGGKGSHPSTPGSSSSSNTSSNSGAVSYKAGDSENDRFMVTLAVTLYECIECV